MYENSIQFAEKKQACDSQACFAWCHSKHIYQPLCHFSWSSPWMASSLRYAASQVQKHKCRRIHTLLGKTQENKYQCYVIKDALCWFRWGEACGQEIDTWTFCGCFPEWSEVKHSYGWKTSVIWCQISRHLTERDMVT